jgi:hypothetical protein
MNKHYLGTLQHDDPLYEVLVSHVFTNVSAPRIHVSKMASGRVYQYTEEKTRAAIVGKFFQLHDNKQDRIYRIKSEYDNLEQIRSYGFDTFPHYVVRPINRDETIGLALTEEFICGKDLDYFLKKAIYEGKGKMLKEKLSKLAAFLFAFHDRTETNNIMQPDKVSSYFIRVVNKLLRQTVISDYEKRAYLKMMDMWMNSRMFQAVNDVIVHGDATPTNFLFTESGNVVAIDLERMKRSDPVYDIGMVCGELKHAFIWRTGNQYAAEPFIRYFLKEYTACFHDPKRAFWEITHRNPFYMAMTELRIARNEYLSWNCRKRLAHEATECLRWGLKLK